MRYGAEIFINSDATLASIQTIRSHFPPPATFPGRKTSRRGAVHGMSAASARRLRRLLGFVKYTRNMSFVTLTYRDSVEMQKVKRDIHTLTMRLRRKFPKAWGIWKIELQARGVWHIHLLLVNVPYWRWSELVRVWGEISGQDAARATNIKQVKSLRQLRSYLAKYIAKKSALVDTDTGEISHTGRVWGVFNRSVAVFVVDSAYCSVREYWTIKRVTRRLRYDALGWNYWVYRASYIKQLLTYMRVDIDTYEFTYSQLARILY